MNFSLNSYNKSYKICKGGEKYKCTVNDYDKVKDDALKDQAKLVEEVKKEQKDLTDNKISLKGFKNTVEFFGKSYQGNFFEYGKETLWWGRRVAACKAKIKNIIRKSGDKVVNDRLKKN